MVEGSRPIPRWLADVVQAFELDQKRLVGVEDVLAARPELGREGAWEAVRALLRRGWLHPTGVRGAYEFVPGAAAGPYPSGDPWLVLRAALRQHPDRAQCLHVGAQSAAWLLGYSERAPRPHVVVAETGTWVPRPVQAAYRVLTTSPAPASGVAQDLPVPTPPELFAEVAQLATRLPLDAATGWLRRLLNATPPEAVTAALRGRSVTTRARAGYIADACGAVAHAEAIAGLGPVGRGPFYTGPVRREGPYSPRWHVYDSGRIAQETPLRDAALPVGEGTGQGQAAQPTENRPSGGGRRSRPPRAAP